MTIPKKIYLTWRFEFHTCDRRNGFPKTPMRISLFRTIATCDITYACFRFNGGGIVGKMSLLNFGFTAQQSK